MVSFVVSLEVGLAIEFALSSASATFRIQAYIYAFSSVHEVSISLQIWTSKSLLFSNLPRL